MKKVAGGTTRIFHYDLRGHLIAETDQNQQMVAEYVYLGDQLLAMIKPGENVYYYHNDHLGTPQVLTNDSQGIAWKAVYTPFGEAVPSIHAVENPFRFPGQYYDQETGLHYNYFRYYNPQTGRYITPDPIGLEGGINLFAYVQNNPINLIDPLGLTQRDIDLGISIIKETQKDLRFPKNVDPSIKSDKVLGQYNYFTDTIKINEKYLNELNDQQAGDLLDTLIHETLHANDSFLKQLLDTFREHPDIYKEAERRLKEILERYLRERRIDPCK